VLRLKLNEPAVRAYVKEALLLMNTVRYRSRMLYPPGHFHSAIPDLAEVSEREERIFGIPSEVEGVDLNVDEQLRLLEDFKQYYIDLPFTPEKKAGLRYYFANSKFSYADAIVLYSMIRHLRPRKFVEIGSGFSSCVALDTNEIFFNNAISCTFIDPYPEYFLHLLKDGDQRKIELLTKHVQEVEVEKFLSLSAGDILFVDSSHVSKIGSDVNFLFFSVLPRIAKGVYVHLHDIFYPFEYPRQVVYGGIYWNEAYLLRAFLQFNHTFRIVFFNSFLNYLHKPQFFGAMPLCEKNPGGSIWLKRVRR
jgi:hypothetical protein